jgi:tRNA pseudouridine55 synthase
VKSDGAILVNKHCGITSFDVVSALRNTLRVRRTGHCGALDPLATGLVIVCFGRATKLTQFITDEDKEYSADILLGSETATYDRYGVVTKRSPVNGVRSSEVEAALGCFVGRIRQAVPAYSAAKHKGRPLYEYARSGADIPDKTREVTIHEIRIVDFASPHIIVNVACSKGTYIRSLAHDVGRKLGCGAHLFGLCRTRVGGYRLANSLTLSQIAARSVLGKLDERVISMSDLVGFARVTVADSKRPKVANGVDLFTGDVARCAGGFDVGDNISVVDSSGRLLAVGEALQASSEIEARRRDGVPVFKYLRVM